MVKLFSGRSLLLIQTLNKLQPFKLQTSLMDYHRNDTAKKRSKPYTHLTAIQKKEICQRQKDNSYR